MGSLVGTIIVQFVDSLRPKVGCLNLYLVFIHTKFCITKLKIPLIAATKTHYCQHKLFDYKPPPPPQEKGFSDFNRHEIH
jgi:hypothetical protein